MKEASPTNDKYNFALYIPVIKHQQWENQAGRVILYYSTRDPVRRFAGWLVKKSPVNTLDLDELGSKAWLLLDGERSVYEISMEINKDGKDTSEEALRRLVTFLRYLAKKGWITFKGVRSREDLQHHPVGRPTTLSSASVLRYPKDTQNDENDGDNQ